MRSFDGMHRLLNRPLALALLSLSVLLAALIAAAPDGARAGADGEQLPGDVDCSTTLRTDDALVILRFVAELPYEQAPQCPPVGPNSGELGDLNCDGAVDAIDALAMLRFLVALPVELPPGCPPIGGPDSFTAVDNFWIDMDPGGVPGNTDSSVGSIEPCARMNENDTLDADEDGTDAIDVDIVAGPVGFPLNHRLVGFEFELRYPIGVSVVERNLSLLLSQGGNGNLFKAFVDPVPDSNGSFHAGALDLNSNSPGNDGDVGPGALARLRLRSSAGFDARVGALKLERTAGNTPGIFAVDHNNAVIFAENMVDTDGDEVPDSVAEVAQLALDMPCPEQPAPSITPAP